MYTWSGLPRGHQSCGALPTLLGRHHWIGRYVPWQLGRLDGWDLWARGCMAAHKYCQLLLPKTERKRDPPAGRPWNRSATTRDSLLGPTRSIGARPPTAGLVQWFSWVFAIQGKKKETCCGFRCYLKWGWICFSDWCSCSCMSHLNESRHM